MNLEAVDQVLGEIGASLWIIGKQKHELWRETVKPVPNIGDRDETQTKLRFFYDYVDKMWE